MTGGWENSRVDGAAAATRGSVISAEFGLALKAVRVLDVLSLGWSTNIATSIEATLSAECWMIALQT
ncbi:MAG: hypothetical protein Rhob2KO_35790 [Rhodopirellula baltica]